MSLVLQKATVDVNNMPLALEGIPALFPVSQEGMEKLGRMKDGRRVIVTVETPRSPDQHRMFFAVLKIVYDNQEQFASIDELRRATMVEIGETVLESRLDGTRQIMPKSLKYASMKQEDFNRVFDASLDAWAKFLGVDPLSLKTEAMEKEGLTQ